MMLPKQNKLELVNEKTTNRRHPDSALGIYLVVSKVAQCRQVAKNKREKEEAKRETAKNETTRNIHIQVKQSKAFDR